MGHFSSSIPASCERWDNPAYASVDGVLFNKDQTRLIRCPEGKVGGHRVPDTVTGIGYQAFSNCVKLVSVTLPDTVTSLADGAFAVCSSLTNLTIPSSVTSIGYMAFGYSTNLTTVFFKGNCPYAFDIFLGADRVSAYYLPGTTGWGTTFAGRRAALWNPTAQGSGIRTNRFGFTISGTPDIPFVVEASTSLAAPAWTPLQTSTLTNGSIYFSDPAWTSHPTRFYRLRSP